MGQTGAHAGIAAKTDVSTCTRCGRSLTDPISVQVGMGPVCRTKESLDRQIPMPKDKHDLPFDPETGDVTFGNGWDGAPHFNIPRRHIHHSPSGWSWGYSGSGPADFALNILAHFIDPTKLPLEDDTVRLWDGSSVPTVVWDLHQPFKEHFLATRSQHRAHTISGSEIRSWLRGSIMIPDDAIR